MTQGKAPNPKLQVPGKLQISTFKCPKKIALWYFGVWVIEICLELGLWDLELKRYCSKSLKHEI